MSINIGLNSIEFKYSGTLQRFQNNVSSGIGDVSFFSNAGGMCSGNKSTLLLAGSNFQTAAQRAEEGAKSSSDLLESISNQFFEADKYLDLMAKTAQQSSSTKRYKVKTANNKKFSKFESSKDNKDEINKANQVNHARHPKKEMSLMDSFRALDEAAKKNPEQDDQNKPDSEINKGNHHKRRHSISGRHGHRPHFHPRPRINHGSEELKDSRIHRPPVTEQTTERRVVRPTGNTSSGSTGQFEDKTTTGTIRTQQQPQPPKQPEPIPERKPEPPKPEKISNENITKDSGSFKNNTRDNIVDRNREATGRSDDNKISSTPKPEDSGISGTDNINGNGFDGTGLEGMDEMEGICSDCGEPLDCVANSDLTGGVLQSESNDITTPMRDTTIQRNNSMKNIEDKKNDTLIAVEEAKKSTQQMLNTLNNFYSDAVLRFQNLTMSLGNRMLSSESSYIDYENKSKIRTSIDKNLKEGGNFDDGKVEADIEDISGLELMVS